MQILQLTDPHLLADPAGRLKDVPTRQSFGDVFQAAVTAYPDADYLLITGDLAHDETEATYLALRQAIGDWLPRLRIVPGNHDNRPAMRRVFSDIVQGPENRVNFSQSTGDGWRIIGLDSHVPGEVAGHIDGDQIDWLEAELADHADQRVLLCLHHPPVPVAAAWLNAIGLREPERLLAVVERWPQIALMLLGHVHHEFSTRVGATQVVTTPSTAVQFCPDTPTPELDPLPPGYRVIETREGALSTSVHRLPELRFPPRDV